MNYKKVRGHHCWWIERSGLRILSTTISRLISDEEHEHNIDELIEMEEKLRLIKLTLAANEAGEIEGDATRILSEIAFEWSAERIRGEL